MGVLNGQPVSAEITNPAFINKNIDDTMPNRLALENPLEGDDIYGTQTALNKLYSATGAGEAVTGTIYSAPASTITDGDSHETALAKLAEKFDPATGHTHDGTNGNGSTVVAGSVGSVVLKGYIIQGATVSLTGASIDVSSLMTGQTPSAGSTSQGVVITAPYNYVTLRDSSNTAITDGSGNVVYGRLTYLASVWTLTFYVHTTVEVAYTFAAPISGEWYYQQLFNPIVNAPVYDPGLFTPSDNATADVIDATTALKGKVQLASIAAADVGSSGTIGTTNATVANADHVHRGARSVSYDGATFLYGDIQISGAGGSVSSQAGNIVTLTSPALSATAPSDVGSSGNAGAGSTSSKYDHVHRGVSDTYCTGGAAIYGSVEIGVAGALSVGQALQKITVTGPDFGITAASVASANAGGSATSMSKSDHAHQGVHGISADVGVTYAYGDVQFVGAGSSVVSRTGQIVTVTSSGGGGGGGGTLTWVEDGTSPSKEISSIGDFNYLFSAGLGQQLYAMVKVPAGYTAGSQIKLRTTLFSLDSTGTVLFRSQSTLIRTGSDAINGTSNQRTSTNTALSLVGGGYINIPQEVIMDLTDATGNINGVPVLAGYLIRVRVYRDTDTSTLDFYTPIFGSEITFS